MRLQTADSLLLCLRYATSSPQTAFMKLLHQLFSGQEVSHVEVAQLQIPEQLKGLSMSFKSSFVIKKTKKHLRQLC